jgi:hypothetical protein
MDIETGTYGSFSDWMQAQPTLEVVGVLTVRVVNRPAPRGFVWCSICHAYESARWHQPQWRASMVEEREWARIARYSKPPKDDR